MVLSTCLHGCVEACRFFGQAWLPCSSRAACQSLAWTTYQPRCILAVCCTSALGLLAQLFLVTGLVHHFLALRQVQVRAHDRPADRLRAPANRGPRGWGGLVDAIHGHRRLSLVVVVRLGLRGLDPLASGGVEHRPIGVVGEEGPRALGGERARLSSRMALSSAYWCFRTCQ